MKGQAWEAGAGTHVCRGLGPVATAPPSPLLSGAVTALVLPPHTLGTLGAVTGPAGAPVPSGPHMDHWRITKASSRKGYSGGAHKQTQIMLRPTGQEAGSQQLIRKQSRAAVSRDPEDVLQALLVLERHQGQGGLGWGGASWDSLPSWGAAGFRVLLWGVAPAPPGTGCQSKQWLLWTCLGPPGA